MIQARSPLSPSSRASPPESHSQRGAVDHRNRRQPGLPLEHLQQLGLRGERQLAPGTSARPELLQGGGGTGEVPGGHPDRDAPPDHPQRPDHLLPGAGDARSGPRGEGDAGQPDHPPAASRGVRQGWYPTGSTSRWPGSTCQRSGPADHRPERRRHCQGAAQPGDGRAGSGGTTTSATTSCPAGRGSAADADAVRHGRIHPAEIFALEFTRQAQEKLPPAKGGWGPSLSSAAALPGRDSSPTRSTTPGTSASP